MTCAVGGDFAEGTIPTQAPGIVFVLSDNTAVRSSLLILLHSAGFAARAFGFAVAFIAANIRMYGRCCLIVDHHLPGGIDALKLLDRLPALGMAMPAIIVDDAADLKFRQRAAARGAIAVISKPLVDDMILQTVSATIGQPAIVS